MSRIPMLPPTPADPRVRAMFDEVRAHGIEVPNLYRVLGQSPELFRAWLDFAWPLRLHARTSRRLRELMILRGAQVAKTIYEWVHHVPMALAAGITQGEIDALAQWQASALFTPAERSALQLAEEVTIGPGASAACMADLKAHFSDQDVIELVLTASFYVCVGRFLSSVDVDLEPGYQKPW